MAKEFGQRPSTYFNLKESCIFPALAIDLACAVALWEDDNIKHDEAKARAEEEATIRAEKLEEHKRRIVVP